MNKHLLILAVLVGLAILLSCDFMPDPMSEEEWEESFGEALIAGYTNFEEHFVDRITAIYIFSYEYQPEFTPEEIFAILQEQIEDYRRTFASDNELRLRAPSTTLDYEGFDEYRFLVDGRRRRVTVIFVSIDSPAENRLYPAFIDAFYKYAAEG